MAYADRWQHLADEQFWMCPIKTLGSKGYAASRRAGIPAGKPADKVAAWDGGSFAPGVPEAPGGHTTHLSVVDRHGNMAAITQTINMVWGSCVVAPGTGVLLNNSMVLFDPLPGRTNSIAPGKRPLSSMTPILVLRDGKPFLTLGAPGGRLIMGTVIRVFHNILDFGMGIQQACGHLYLDVAGDKMLVDASVGQNAIDGLKKMGYAMDVRPRTYLPPMFASPTGILVDERRCHGGVDPSTSALRPGIRPIANPQGCNQTPRMVDTSLKELFQPIDG